MLRNSPKVRGLISIGATIVIAWGYYQIDDRSESYKKAAEKDKKPSSETKSDCKAESKSDKKSSSEATSTSSGSNGKPSKAD